MASTVTLNGRTYDLVDIEKLSFSDQRELKRLTGGLNLREIGQGLKGMDPDALYGIILLSAKKANPKFSEADLDNMSMVEVVNSMTSDDDDDEADAAPPPVASLEVVSPSPPSSEATPETIGTPSSPDTTA